MSRSAADATRFTATGPYASSKPGAPGSGAPYKLPSFMSKNNSSSSGSNPSQGPAGDPQETPKQKVERLRAQAKASRMAQSTSRFDRFVDTGREVANKAHKVMVYSLITASGMSSTTDLSSRWRNEDSRLIVIRCLWCSHGLLHHFLNVI